MMYGNASETRGPAAPAVSFIREAHFICRPAQSICASRKEVSAGAAEPRRLQTHHHVAVTPSSPRLINFFKKRLTPARCEEYTALIPMKARFSSRLIHTPTTANVVANLRLYASRQNGFSGTDSAEPNSGELRGWWKVQLNFRFTRFSFTCKRCSRKLGQCSRSVRRSTRKLGQCNRNVRRSSRKLGQCSRNVRQSSRKLGQCSRNVRRSSRKLRQCNRNVRQYCRSFKQFSRKLSACNRKLQPSDILPKNPSRDGCKPFYATRRISTLNKPTN